MGDIVQLMEMDWKNGILFMAAIIIVAVFIIQKFDWVIEKLGITSKRQLAEERQNKEIKALRNHAEKTDNNISKILSGMEELKASVNEVSGQVKVLQDKNDINEAAHLKDRIAEGYRYWHERGEWTSRDKESMEDLIKAYSQYSENSFVHSVVEKEMPQWTVIDD